MAIELWFSSVLSDEEDLIVQNAPCVPREGELIEMGYGVRTVCQVKYGFHETDGNVRVYIRVTM